MRKSDLVMALSLALCVFGLAACGGGSGGDSGAVSEGSEEEVALGFAECMRAHGVDVQDPEPGTGNIEVGGNDPATKKALAACDGKLGDAGQELSAEEGEEFKEGWLAFAECVREHGINMGDPEFLGPGKVHLNNKGIDPSSPAFVAAREACEDTLMEIAGISIGG